MKKIFLVLLFGFLFSENAFAAKRVCIFVHKNYMEIKEPVLLAKRRMLVDLVGCEKGNSAIQNTQDYKIYHFKKRDKILKILYPIIIKDGNVTKDGSKGYDQWTLDKFEIILGEEQYKFFNLPTSAERKLIAEKKATETKKKKKKKKKAEQKSVVKKDTNGTFGGPRENAERVAALSFYRIECGHLTSKGKTMLSAQKSNMDQSVYRTTQRNLSDLVIVEGIDKTCNMLFGVLKPQSLVQ